MEAKARSPRDLFDSKVCYEIPPFQRPYVWNEEDQWAPLWDDVVRLAEELLGGAYHGRREEDLPTHFLGAVVLKQLPNAATDASRYSVIDGQQRLTTLQVLLDAAELAIVDHGDEDDAEAIRELVLNEAARFKGTYQRFKLRPSRIDREAFEQVMDNSLAVTADFADSRLHLAHTFFVGAVRSWADVGGDADKARERLSVLVKVLIQQLQIVAITLDARDDDQLIFETLNARGTPLLAADLIKNFVFLRGEEIGADVDSWADTYWQEFDDEWWRTEIAQGRLFRSRIDMFLQYWLTMRERDEILTDLVFGRFKSYAGDHFDTVAHAEAFLGGLKRDAETFRDLAQLDVESAPGRFYQRVVEALELGATIPVLLWMLSDNHDVPDDQVAVALDSLESWVVRRTLLRRPMNNVNRMMVQLLKDLAGHPVAEAGDVTRSYLAGQTSDTGAWPTDAEVREVLPGTRLYGNVKQQRLRMVFQSLEQAGRAAVHEDVTIKGKLEIEHVMPRGWRTYWATAATRDPKRAAERDLLVNTIGNLTIVTSPLNKELSHRPWTDAEAKKVAAKGRKAGLGKRSLLGESSLLLLNKEIVSKPSWAEADIAERSGRLADLVVSTWPRPE